MNPSAPATSATPPSAKPPAVGRYRWSICGLLFFSVALNYIDRNIIGILKGQTHNHRPVGTELKRELALYAEELRSVRVFKASTDPKTFAEKVYADVFSA